MCHTLILVWGTCYLKGSNYQIKVYTLFPLATSKSRPKNSAIEGALRGEILGDVTAILPLDREKKIHGTR